MKEEYIQQITKLLNVADLELLDFVYQLMKKSVDATQVISSAEHQPSA